MAKYILGKKKSNKPLLLRYIVSLAALTAILIGCYILFLVYAPRFSFIPLNASSVNSLRNKSDTGIISIPKIGVEIPFYSGDQSVLEKGAWHRYPERGDPLSGGNFILSAHRFQLGLTPSGTKAKSPFYNLHKLEEGDYIIITYKNATYEYRVTKKYDVERTAVEIEAPSTEHKLTLYSCAFQGEKAGRIVIEAKLVD